MERREQKIDWLTVALYFIFLSLGWINIYAATSKDPTISIFNFSYFGGKQFYWAIFSALIGLIALNLNSKFIEFGSYVAYGFTIVMLLLVLLFGREVNGARAWFDFGSFRFQPSEFAKLTTALAVAKFMSRVNFSLRNWSDRLFLFALIGLPALLIKLQNDTGTALVFSAFIFVLFLEGLNYFYVILLLLVGIFSILAIVANKVLIIIFIVTIAFSSCYFIFRLRHIALHTIIGVSLIFLVLSVDFVINNMLQAHQRNRIYALFNPDIDPMGANWNTTQSKIAIGSGGFMGKGFLKGTQTKYDFVPQQATDFIFCTVGEEHGWVGSLVVIGLFFIFLYQLFFLAENSKSAFGRIFGYSIAAIFFFHIAVNISMTIGLAPVIGVPLPFFSYGGSSLISFSLMVFILLNLYSNRVYVYASSGRF